MGLIGNVVKGAFNAITSPVRAVFHAARTVVNAAHLVVSVASFGLLGDPKKQWNDLKDSVKGTVFAGAEALLTYGTGGVGGIGLSLARVSAGSLAKGTAAGMVENWAR